MLHAIEHPRKFTENMIDKQNKYIVGGARWGGNEEDATDMLSTLKDTADDSIKKINIEKYKNAEFSAHAKKIYRFVAFSDCEFVNFMQQSDLARLNGNGRTFWGDAGNQELMRENNKKAADAFNARLRGKISGRNANTYGTGASFGGATNNQISYRNADGSINENSIYDKQNKYNAEHQAYLNSLYGYSSRWVKFKDSMNFSNRRFGKTLGKNAG